MVQKTGSPAAQAWRYKCTFLVRPLNINASILRKSMDFQGKPVRFGLAQLSLDLLAITPDRISL